MKIYKDINNKVYVDPILKNHSGLIEITKGEMDAILAPTPEDIVAKVEAEEYGKYLEDEAKEKRAEWRRKGKPIFVVNKGVN